MKKNDVSEIAIGDLAERSGLTLRTIRWYMELGLIIPFNRKGNGRAFFKETDLDQLNKIKSLKEAGFNLDEIQNLLIIIADNETYKKKLTDTLRSTLKKQRAAIFEKEKSLHEIRRNIDNVIAQTGSCEKCGLENPNHDCKGCSQLDILKSLGCCSISTKRV